MKNFQPYFPGIILEQEEERREQNGAQCGRHSLYYFSRQEAWEIVPRSKQGHGLLTAAGLGRKAALCYTLWGTASLTAPQCTGPGARWKGLVLPAMPQHGDATRPGLVTSAPISALMPRGCPY